MILVKYTFFGHFDKFYFFAKEILCQKKVALQILEMVRGKRRAWGDTSYHPEGD